MNKKYLNINEVSKLLDIREHVIRYWDSIDPKTNKVRIEGISTKSKAGTRYFNRNNIAKIKELKNLLYDGDSHNYSLKIADKILTLNKKSHNRPISEQNDDSMNYSENNEKINEILKKIRDLCKQY